MFLSKKNANFVKKLLKDLGRCPKKLQQQSLQEVRNHGNYVKNDFYIENRERSFANVEDENNVSTDEGVLISYDERNESENNNNNVIM